MLHLPGVLAARSATATRACVAVALAVALATCIAAAPGLNAYAASTPGERSDPTPAPSPLPDLEPPIIHGATWHRAGTPVDGRRAVAVTRLPGDRIALLWMDPTRLTFRYIPGTQYPEGSPIKPSDRVPKTWLRGLVAAFNGGFHLKDGAGGYYYAGKTVRPLVPGLAAFTLTRDGAMHVGVWGRTLVRSPDVLVVRENLMPLVKLGVSQARASDSTARWGLANSGLPHANRTALGERTDGSLVFAYGSEVTAVQLADAMVSAGVQTALVLDMNKSWPTGFVYGRSTAAGHPIGKRILPSIWRDPSTYYSQFTKDFVVVQVRHRSGGTQVSQAPLANPA